MDDMKYVDPEEALQRGYKRELYVKWLRRFQANTTLDDLKKSLEAGDMEKAQEEAHRLKGVAGNLSLTALYHQALALEQSIKTRTVEAGAMEALKACFDRTMAGIEGVIQEQPA
jgi:two-component system sensor histidine kinase/response regulator